MEPPIGMRFEDCPIVPYVQALILLLSHTEKLPNRPDLEAPYPTAAQDVIAVVETMLPAIKARPKAAEIIAARGLSDDDVRFLFTLTFDHPYPVYKWLNGHLTANRVDRDVKEKFGPFFKGWSQAYHKWVAEKKGTMVTPSL